MKLFKYPIFIFSVFLLSAVFAFAQDTGGAKGRVCNNRGLGLSFVGITVMQNDKDIKSITTNNKGEFVIEGLKAGKYDFVFKKDGFNTGTLKNVELVNKKIRDLGKGLVLDIDEGKLVIIKGLVFDEEGRSIPNAQVLIEKVLNDDKFEKIGSTFSNNGFDAVDRGEFTFRLPVGVTKYRITAAFRGKSASKEMNVEEAAIYHTAITINLSDKKEN